MFFDPLTSWLVVLLADGAIVANEKFGKSSDLGEWERECIMRNNCDLNDAIRCVKEYDGCSEEAYNKIKCHIGFAAGRYPSNGSREHIRLDADNQEYIIAVLDECAKEYSQQTDEKAQEKALWYQQAAEQAQILWKQQKEMDIKADEERQKRENKKFVYILIGVIILTVLSKILFG